MKNVRNIGVIVGLVLVVCLATLFISGTWGPASQERIIKRWLSVLKTDVRDAEHPLCLRQVKTGEEPDILRFEVPIKYDALTNVGTLVLRVNQAAVPPWLERAPNGNCLLGLNTTFLRPGEHHLQANLIIDRGGKRLRKGMRPKPVSAEGPVLRFYSSNVCQFEAAYSEFSRFGARLYAKLPESNATYAIVLKTPTGVHIRTISGSTINGEIEEYWDLTDTDGNVCTNDSVTAEYHVVLASSRKGTHKFYLHRAIRR